MGMPHCQQLQDNHGRETVFKCTECGSHLFTSKHIISDNFHGKHGSAFLVRRTVNFKNGPRVIRNMMTGNYSVSDTLCNLCDSYLGWKYITAESPDEKYKEGKFVIEISEISPVGFNDKYSKAMF